MLVSWTIPSNLLIPEQIKNRNGHNLKYLYIYKYIMENTNTIWQQATNSHLDAQQEPYKKA